MSDARARMRELAAADPEGYFETLYATANGDWSTIPWADRGPSPLIVGWAEKMQRPDASDSVLVVGCGLGDDAQYLASRGAKVTAFDLSPSAIEWCRRRFPESKVEFLAADLFALPEEWNHRFSIVVEINTLQVLQGERRRRAMEIISTMLAVNGLLVVCCRGREAHEPAGSLPYPLLESELKSFAERGLATLSFEDFLDKEDPPVRRFRAVFQR